MKWFVMKWFVMKWFVMKWFVMKWFVIKICSKIKGYLVKQDLLKKGKNLYGYLHYYINI